MEKTQIKSRIGQLYPYLAFITVFLVALRIGRYLYWEKDFSLQTLVLVIGAPAGILAIVLFIKLAWKYYD